MANLKRFGIRVVRKSAFLSNRVLKKVTTLSTRVENKATRILDGTDFSYHIDSTVPLEKVYYTSLPYITPINPALPLVDQKAAVVLLLPTLDGKSFFGGTATALVVAARAAQLKDMPLRIVQTLKTGKADDLSEFLSSEGIDMPAKNITISSVAERAYNVYGYLPMHPDDIFIASAWWDAFLINNLPLNKKFIYLVQDFEPIFYNNSDLYVLAESTYKMTSYIPFCNTKLMYDFMTSRSYPQFISSNASWFEPAVSRIKSGSRQTKTSGEKKRLFLYGRPDVHRNLFFTALDAIDRSIKAGYLDPSEWEFFMAGQDSLPNIKLSSGATIINKGKMSLKAYIAFSKTIDIALSPMMAPHPNYPTLEFCSIGTIVVTTRYANKTDLSNYSDNIVMCDADTESMAKAIKVASSAKSLAKNGIFASLPDNWQDSLDKPLLKILSSL